MPSRKVKKHPKAHRMFERYVMALSPLVEVWRIGREKHAFFRDITGEPCSFWIKDPDGE